MIKLIGAIKSQMSASQLTSEISFPLIADCSHWSKLHAFWAPASFNRTEIDVFGHCSKAQW